MDELIGSLPESHAFVYPWTQLGAEDVDSVVTGAIIYDRLYYLNYNLPTTIEPSIFQGIAHLVDAERIGYQGVLKTLMDSGRLAPLSAEKIRNSVRVSPEEHHYDTFTNNCLRNLAILRDSGLTSRAHMRNIDRVYLADAKIDTTLRTAYGMGTSDRRGEIQTSWENCASILAGYADYVAQSHRASPFGVDSFHSEVLQVLLKEKSTPLNAAGIVLRNLLEIPVPTISKAWKLDLSNLEQKLDEIRNTRRKAFIEIEKCLDDSVPKDTSGSVNDSLCNVTNDLIPKLKDLEQHIAQFIPKENQVSRPVKLVGYVAAGMWFAVTFFMEETRNFSIFSGTIKDPAEWIARRIDRWLKKRERTKIEGHQLYGTHCFLQKASEFSLR